MTKTVQLIGYIDGLLDQRKEIKDKIEQCKRKRRKKYMNQMHLFFEDDMTFSMASPFKDKSDRVCVPLEGTTTSHAKEDSKIFCKSIDEYKLAVVLNL